MAKMTKFLAISCLHAPITSPRYWDWLIKQIEDFKPDVFVNCGDWYEGKPAKRWPAWSDEDWTMLDEHAAVAKQAKVINELVPGRKIWIHGNHEDNAFGNSPNRIPEDIRSAIRWEHNADMSAAMKDWTVITRYSHRSCYRLGPITFQHGCATTGSAEKDASYLYGSPYGLYICGHTHTCVPVTQARERRVRLPFWYANPGCGADWDRMHYMDRFSMALWGRGAIIGETAGVEQRRRAYASKQWDAELRIQEMAH